MPASLLFLLLALPLPAFGGAPPVHPPRDGDTTWSLTLVSREEPGVPLEISGTVFRHDGKTPAAGVRIYLYHTDAGGNYSVGNRNGNRDPRIRGWLTTNARGQYRIRTIRLGSYPGFRAPAHIHSKAVYPDGKETWIEEFLFADDPYISEKDRKKPSDLGDFSPVMKVTRGDSGVLHCTRDIILAP